ncbi:MAG TPA: L-threonylcarbamoyladenylate synthase [Burkholderiales bacterium]|nr:L-threonylcarbamoyladenylate synthase [Burkholderiales bacterium]
MKAVPDREIEKAVVILRSGGLVAFPTETVYGLGADALNPEAIKKIFAAKGRPQNHPLIVHLADASHLVLWAREIPVAAERLAERFWPGPLTLILRRAERVPDAITGGQDTVGLRVPSHPVAHALLQAFGSGIAAPSANRYGRLSPTTAEHVRAELGGRVDMILDGGSCDFGIESTIVDLSSSQATLLRPGKISASELEKVLGTPVGRPGPRSPRAPGTIAAHYAPQTPLQVVSGKDLAETVRHFSALGKRAAVLAHRHAQIDRANIIWFAAPSQAAAYARELYAKLRRLDQYQYDVILVEQVPEGEEWDAVRDRLAKSAAPRVEI